MEPLTFFSTSARSFTFLAKAFLSQITGREFAVGDAGICTVANNTRTTQFFLDEPRSHDACCGTDWMVFLLQFLVMHSISWGSRYVILFPSIRFLIGKRATKLRTTKMGQTAVACSFHIFSGYFAYRLFAHQKWIWPSHKWSEGFVEEEDMTVDAAAKFYYLLYAARYLSDLLSLPFEPIRSDFWAYAAHHFITIVLVLLSAMYGFFRVGAVIMLFMDVADPFMLVAKLFRYCSTDRSDLQQFCADRLFEAFAVAFVVTRNMVFPYVAVVCIQDFPNTRPSSVLKGLLAIMAVLQTFWLGLIVKAAIHQFSNEGNVDDIRSDDEDSEDGTNGQETPVAKKRK